jgi:hypothetical protein
MSEIRDRNDFIKRTKEILDQEYDYFKENKDREVTFLLNCLLGTIVAVTESKDKNLESKIDDEFLKLLPDEIGFIKTKNQGLYNISNTSTNSIEFIVCHKDNLKEKRKSWLLKKIRNGIAHLNIKWENEMGECKVIRLWNEPVPNIKDFEIVFTIQKLRNFAVELSKMFFCPKN